MSCMYCKYLKQDKFDKDSKCYTYPLAYENKKNLTNNYDPRD